MLDDFGRALQSANLADPSDILVVPLHPELEVLVGVEPGRIDGEFCHDRLPQRAILAICCSLITTNSAGFSGAKPTRMLTIPRFTSSGVVVLLSHLTK